MPVLLVEHDIDRVFPLADAVTVMNDGQVLGRRHGRGGPLLAAGAGGLHRLGHRMRWRARARPSAAAARAVAGLEGVNTFYGKSHILHDVAFDVHENEIVALLGRNGAGKSTLLKTVVGIAPPASGSIALGGEALARRPSAEITRRGVSYVPQGRGLFAGMSVAENMELGRLRRRNQRGQLLGRGQDLRVLPAHQGALALAGRLPVRRRAADGGGGARAVGRHPRAAARRAVRRPGPGGRRGVVRGVRQAAPARSRS